MLLAWSVSGRTWSKSLPSPSKTWEVSKPYVVEPFEKRGEMDQG
ncbi:MAG: nitrate ABC transporter, permease protein, partial [Acidobacteria bacterium]